MSEIKLNTLALLVGLTLVKVTIYVALAQPFHGVEQGLCQWDCKWYTHTIQNGYDTEPHIMPSRDLANWAFFPLFPVLSRGLMIITSLNAFWSGTAVAIMCFSGFAILSCRYRALTRGRASQDSSWLIMLAVDPFSLYFFIPYSESTYLVLTLALLLAAEARSAIGQGLATCLLTATRPTGVLAIPHLAVQQAASARQAFRRGMKIADRIRLLSDATFPMAIAPLGIASYMAYLWWLTGDALAFSHIQLAWGRVLSNPIKAVYWGLAENDWPLLFRSDMSEIVAPNAYKAAFAFPAVAACAWLLVRRRILECWLLGSSILLALSTGVLSLPRLVVANPIFLLVVGDVVDLIGSRAVRIGLAVICIAIQLFLIRSWLLESSLLA